MRSNHDFCLQEESRPFHSGWVTCVLFLCVMNFSSAHSGSLDICCHFSYISPNFCWGEIPPCTATSFSLQTLGELLVLSSPRNIHLTPSIRNQGFLKEPGEKMHLEWDRQLISNRLQGNPQICSYPIILISYNGGRGEKITTKNSDRKRVNSSSLLCQKKTGFLKRQMVPVKTVIPGLQLTEPGAPWNR